MPVICYISQTPIYIYIRRMLLNVYYLTQCLDVKERNILRLKGFLTKGFILQKKKKKVSFFSLQYSSFSHKIFKFHIKIFLQHSHERAIPWRMLSALYNNEKIPRKFHPWEYILLRYVDKRLDNMNAEFNFATPQIRFIK